MSFANSLAIKSVEQIIGLKKANFCDLMKQLSRQQEFSTPSVKLFSCTRQQ